MYKYILENAGDISLMALVPMILFFVIFLGTMVRAMTKNRSYIDRMANLPLDDSKSELAETE